MWQKIGLQLALLLQIITNSYSCEFITVRNKLDSKGIKNAVFFAFLVIFSC